MVLGRWGKHWHAADHTNTCMTWLLVTVAFAFSLVGNVAAQDAELRMQKGPYYVGEPVTFQVSVSSDGSQDVSCRYGGETTSSLIVTGPDVSQSRQSFFSQDFSGNIVKRESVEYRFNFQVTSTTQGTKEIGPFFVSIDGQEQKVDSTAITLEKLAPDPEMQLEVDLERDTFYVGERVPITFTWSFVGETNELNYVYERLQIRSPLFDQFEFEDKRTRGSNRMVMTSSAGSEEVDATATEARINGKPGIVLSSTRTMLVDSPGTYRDVVTTCRTDRVTAWQRGFFGDVSPRSRRPAIALSEPLSFTVKELPFEGRPAGFSGAVGEGFSISAAANRSVVRVGDPISLDVTISGAGNLEKLSFPSLIGADGLDEGLFQLPGESPAGTYADNKKQFKLTLRIKDETVTQIPALPFSWFDPVAEKFQTTYSKPIAVQVEEAELITADNVVSANSNEQREGTTNGRTTSSTSNAVTTAMSFVGANLAIEKNSAKLLATSIGWYSESVGIASCYGLGVLAIGLAVVIRRLRAVDPRLVERKQLLKTQRRRISTADKLPAKQAAETIAAALRETLSSLQSKRRQEADALIAKCETLVYSPVDSADSTAIANLVDQSLAVFDQLAKEA